MKGDVEKKEEDDTLVSRSREIRGSRRARGGIRLILKGGRSLAELRV